ncbi:hypothetical protein [Flammeovirga sp. SubArs3]|uniref:hypothetical protein n=1 Tax=Flammeovirga sp. SubArs3 TaxID=2995316 RepID=UPI00248AFF40|nr:hypothetical protein [Flammeovirga sp. SubArs3]
MRVFIYFSIMSLFFSCRENYDRENLFKNTEYYNSSNIFLLDTANNFLSIKKFIKSQSVNVMSSLLFRENQEVPILSNLSYLINNGDGGCYKKRNILIINDTSKITEQRIIDFILNNNKSKKLSESPLKAILVLAYSDTYQVEKISKDLESILNAYKKAWRLYSNNNLINMKQQELLGIYEAIPCNIIILYSSDIQSNKY